MIKLKTGSLLLHSVGGDFELFDLNELHDCLYECCLEVGVDDQELPSDIINVVITFANDQEALQERELERLIVLWPSCSRRNGAPARSSFLMNKSTQPRRLFRQSSKANPSLLPNPSLNSAP